MANTITDVRGGLPSRLMPVYGLLLIASKLLKVNVARLRTYIRPLESAYVDAGP